MRLLSSTWSALCVASVLDGEENAVVTPSLRAEAGLLVVRFIVLEGGYCCVGPSP